MPARNPSLAALLGYLDQTLLHALTTIRAITDDNQLNDAEKVEGIRTLLNPHETSLSADGINLAALQADLASELSEDDYYRILEARSVRIQNRLSPIIKAMIALNRKAVELGVTFFDTAEVYGPFAFGSLACRIAASHHRKSHRD